MNDGRARLMRQQCGGDKPHQVIALDKSSLFIEEKAAVKVAVPGQAHRGLVVTDRLGRDLTVFRQQGVGHPVGKGRVRGVADLDELEGQMRLQGVQHRPGAAVAGVDHHLEGFQDLGVDVAQQVGDIGLQAIHGSAVPPGARRRAAIPGPRPGVRSL